MLSGLKLPSPKMRLYLYAVATAMLGLLVFYEIVSAESVPAWLSLLATLLALGGNATATVAVTQNRRDGLLP